MGPTVQNMEAPPAGGVGGLQQKVGESGSHKRQMQQKMDGCNCPLSLSTPCTHPDNCLLISKGWTHASEDCDFVFTSEMGMKLRQYSKGIIVILWDARVSFYASLTWDGRQWQSHPSQFHIWKRSNGDRDFHSPKKGKRFFGLAVLSVYAIAHTYTAIY